MIRYYLDVVERIRIERKLKEFLPEAVIPPGLWPGMGMVLEASAFGGRIMWSHKRAPHILPVLRGLRDIDELKPPEPGKMGLCPLFLTQVELVQTELKSRDLGNERLIQSMGPAEISGLLLGYENDFLGLYEDPEWLKRLSEEFILAYIRGVYSEFPEVIRIYDNEGFQSDRHIELVLRFGADIWHFGSDVDGLGDLYVKLTVQRPFNGSAGKGPRSNPKGS